MENHVNARLARAVLPQLASSTRGNIVFLLLSFPLGLISFLIAVIGLSVGLGTLVIWIGLPILFATLFIIRGMAEVERRMASSLLRKPMPYRLPAPSEAPSGFLHRFGRMLSDPYTWTSTIYMLLKLPLGILSFVLTLTLSVASAALVLFPLGYLISLLVNVILLKNGISSDGTLIPGFIEIHGSFDLVMFARSFIGVPVGIVLWLFTRTLLNSLARVSGELANALLGPGIAYIIAQPPASNAAPGVKEEQRYTQNKMGNEKGFIPMQQDIDTPQTSTNDRAVNTDPREQARAYSGTSLSHAELQPQPRKRAPWRTVLFCALALALAAGIAGLTGGIPISALHKTLPTRAFSLNGHGSLVVNENSGSVRIHASNTSQLIVRATEYAYGLGSDLNDLQVRYVQQGKTLTIIASESWGVAFANRGIDLDITVPSSIDLAVHGNSTDVNLSGIDGQIGTTLDSGNLHLDNVNGSLDLQTSSGGITITNEHGPVRAHTDSGDIGIDHAVGTMNLSTNAGSITLNETQISGRDHFQTDSGDIQFSGTLDPQGAYRMETSNGNITLNLPAKSSFQLTTATDTGGIQNDFSASAVGSAPRASIMLKTDNGDIRVQKR
jgi:hypothetical protein